MDEVYLKVTKQDYAILVEAAAASGKQPEILLHEMIRNLQKIDHEKRMLTPREAAERLYRDGVIANLATHKPLTPEEEAELERIAQKAGRGKPASEMVIEDRGPY